ERLRGADIRFYGVWIVGRHRAAAPQLGGVDDGFADSKAMPGPFTFLKALHSANDDVRTQTPTIETHIANCAIRRDQKWQNIETLRPVVVKQLGIRTNCLSHEGQGFAGIPDVTGDLGLAISTERTLQAQQLVLRPRGDHMAVGTPAVHLADTCHDTPLDS